MKSIEVLRNKGKGQKVVIFATGHSYTDFDYNNIDMDIVRIEINKMRINTRIDYSIYYDKEWKEYYNKFDKLDRELIGFETHLSKHTKYSYDTIMIPFSDSGFHALYLASEIMNFQAIYLVGYDYYKVGGMWHPYKDDFIDDRLDKKKLEILQNQIDKYSSVEWSNTIFNCNKDSALKVFPFGLPYKN